MNPLPASGSSIGSTSADLIRRVQANDQDAWRNLVRLYGPLVDFWLRRSRALQPADVNDVFQEVFQAVARNIGAFRQDLATGSFRGWLRTITRSKLVDHLRKRGAEPQATGGSEARQRMEELPEPLPPEPDEVSQDVEFQVLRVRVLEVIRSEFEERTWQMFWRVTAEGQSVKDVAADLGVSPSAVRLAKSRVLRRLREEVTDLEL